jgi:hypothetical protein
MNLSAKVCGGGRSAQADVLGQQGRGMQKAACQKTERDLNERS